MEKITMTRKQLKRHAVITQVIDGLITREKAAKLLELSVRQIDRIKKSYLQEGIESLIHKNTGRKPAHALDNKLKCEIVRLKENTPYSQANFKHFQELLELHHGIRISYSSLYTLLKKADMLSPLKKKRRKKHPRRQRMPYKGELLQIDATPFEWFGGNEKFALHAAIDDATGIITGAYFTHNECLHGYLEVMRQTCIEHGIPQAVYSDKHTIFRSPNTEKLTLEDEVQGKTVKLTQFGRALDELGIRLIYAHSPQAKGRIERLWATLQSRLPVELAIRNITTIEQANEFLKEYLLAFNNSFSVNHDSESLFVKYDGNYDIDEYLCVKYTRKMDNAGSFSINRKCFKVLDRGFPIIPGKAAVSVLISTRKGIRVSYKGRAYDTIQYIKPDRPPSIPKNHSKIVTTTKPHLVHSSDEWKSIWHYESYNDTLKFLYGLFFRNCS